MIVYPNAKINLGLNIIDRRNDVYHNISSVFYPVYDLFDILEVSPSKDYSFSSGGLAISSRNNICDRVFKLLKSKYKIPNVNIYLEKRIPIGSGLGGGSADASFLLIVLNQMFNLGLGIKSLTEYASQIGADCPFFLKNTPQLVERIGDVLTPISLDLHEYEFKIIFPQINISTKEAYSLVQPSMPLHEIKYVIGKDIKTWKNNLHNDFEKVILKKYPEILKAKNKLYTDGAVYASLSGSGSAVYGIFKKS